MPPFEKVQAAQEYNPRQLNDVQTNVDRSVGEWVNNPLSKAVLLEDVELTGATNTAVEHKLNREPRGWWVAGGVTTNNVVQEVSKDERFLTLLINGTDQTISLVVF